MIKLTKEQIARVQSLEDERGVLTPDRIVADAKKKSSPLHTLFEWNKDKAAEFYWIDQAREVIASVRIAYSTETHTFRGPVYLRDPDAKGDEQGYRSATALRADPAKARESLILTLKIACGHLTRAMELAEPLGLSAEIDVLIEEIVGLSRKLQAAA